MPTPSRSFGTKEQRAADAERVEAQREARLMSGQVKAQDRSNTPCAAGCGKRVTYAKRHNSPCRRAESPYSDPVDHPSLKEGVSNA